MGISRKKDRRRGAVAVELQEPAGGDRDPRARDARHEGNHLCDADADRRPEPDVLELAGLGAAVGDPEQRREDGEADRDLPRRALGGPRSRSRRPHRRSPPGSSRRRRARRSSRRPSRSPAGQRADQCRCEPHDLIPEIHDHGDERPEVQGDVEGLVEVRVGPRDSPTPRARGRGSGARTTRSEGARSAPGRCRG